MGGRQADGLHPDRRRCQLPYRHGARPGNSAREGPRRLPLHGRQLRQQEPEPRLRPDRRGAREERRRAGEARAVAQGRLDRGARPLADGAVLQGRRQERRHAAGDPDARLQRDGAVPQEHRQHRRRRDLSVREHRDVDLAGLHQQDGVGELPGTGIPAGLLRHPVDDGRRRRQAEDGSGRVHPEEHDAESRRPDAVYDLLARRVHSSWCRGIPVEDAMEAAAGV